MAPIYAFLLFFGHVAATWDCDYELGRVYRYHYTTELQHTVSQDSQHEYGLTMSGAVTLIPLEIEQDSFYIEVYIESLAQQGIYALYCHHLDYASFSGIFTVGKDTISLPENQHPHQSNLLRGIISALKIKSCTMTGVYTEDEVSVAGEHSTMYESNTVNNLMFDQHILFPYPEEVEDWYSAPDNNIDVIRTLGDISAGRVVGTTGAHHRDFIKEAMRRGTDVEYSYLIGTPNIVQSCVVYEKYSPRLTLGYSSSSQATVRTTLKLVSSELDPDSTHRFTLREIRELKLYGSQLEESSILFDFSLPNLRPSVGFVAAGRKLEELLKQGYERTSKPVLQAWLDMVRNIYVGVTVEEAKAVLESKQADLLPWYIDATNINGTAQLHLLTHSAIKITRASWLTDRFISTKQFTTDPPLRMVKWLLKTCGIDRYEEVCSLAVASSATSYFESHNDLSTVVADVLAYLKEVIETTNGLERRRFFVSTLGNMKLAEAVRYLIRLALFDGEASIRLIAVETLHFQDQSEITFDDRLQLLDVALQSGQEEGLYFSLVTSPHHTLSQLIQYAMERICQEEDHILSTFFYQTLTYLSEPRVDPVRARIVREEYRVKPADCRLCDSGSQPHFLTSSFLFGSRVLGGEVRLRRHESGDKLSLALNFLPGYGSQQDILQTSVELPDLGAEREQGKVEISANGQRLRSIQFQVGEQQAGENSLLLSDVTALFPTVSGIPVSFSIYGSLRTETAVDARRYPHVQVSSDLGVLLGAEFKLAGAPLGWQTTTYFHTAYQSDYAIDGDSAGFTLELSNLALTTETRTAGGISPGGRVVDIVNPNIVFNTTLYKQRNIGSSSVCQDPVWAMTLSLAGPSNARFDPKSYLGRWLLDQSGFPDLDLTRVYEQTLSDCYQSVLFEDLETSDELGQELLTVHIQALFGIFELERHKEVKTFGGKSPRNLRLEGPAVEVLGYVRRLRYYPLPGHSAPDLVTLVLEGLGQLGVLLFAEQPCI